MHFYILWKEPDSSISQADQNPVGRASARLRRWEMSGREIARLASGEMWEKFPLRSLPALYHGYAQKKSLVLSIPQQQLATKLQQDVSLLPIFIGRATLLADRLEKI